MVQIVLIHPGETDYSQQRRIQGNLDMPLNDQGVAEVARLVQELQSCRLDALYACDGEPAMQTGQLITDALGLKVRKLDRMQNLNYGLWQGMLIDEVRIKQPKVYRQWQEQPENVCPPQGEMLAQAAERVQATMIRLLKRHKAGVIGIVVPEPLASLVRQYVDHRELGDLWKVACDHARCELLEVKPEAAVSI